MIKKRQLLDLTILSVRILLALIFISYGIGKLSGGQFGNLTEEELATPIKELSLFKIAWYLFDHQPFKIFIGISQIIASLMLLYNRTMILGALLLTPIVLNILVIDLTIMPYGLKIAFAFRLTAYLCYIGFLLFYYKNQLAPAWNAVLNINPFRYANHTKISYFLVILFIPALELAPAVLKMIYFALSHPQSFWNGLKALF
ncbi:DoxX family membrane protein [Olivibacter sp. CPCC 100613]|uniref:DoxX family membrane protein n=1 Tax=Olivibacter sp. CPCC 100613 TaxID=3079931 RepID=UPI002FFCBD67